MNQVLSTAISQSTVYGQFFVLQIIYYVTTPKFVSYSQGQGHSWHLKGVNTVSSVILFGVARGHVCLDSETHHKCLKRNQFSLCFVCF